MSQLDLARKAGLLEPEVNWNVLIKTLGTYNSPQARALYDKLNKRYNLDTSLNKETIMAEDTTETPKEETPTVPQSN